MRLFEKKWADKVRYTKKYTKLNKSIDVQEVEGTHDSTKSS